MNSNEIFKRFEHQLSRRDIEILLLETLGITRAQLLLEVEINDDLWAEIQPLLQRAVNGEPIAYIVGHQPFWTLDLDVSPDVLIPRPETEHLLEWLLQHLPAQKVLRLVDLGTGSGAIALALASERKLWKIDATDVSEQALQIAKHNAEKHHIDTVNFYLGDWFSALPDKQYDAIVSNPPYVQAGDQHLKDLTFEPQAALVAADSGMAVLQHIIANAAKYLVPRGTLMVEHGYDQAERVVALFKTHHYQHIDAGKDIAGQPRFVSGQVEGD